MATKGIRKNVKSHDIYYVLEEQSDGLLDRSWFRLKGTRKQGVSNKAIDKIASEIFREITHGRL